MLVALTTYKDPTHHAPHKPSPWPSKPKMLGLPISMGSMRTNSTSTPSDGSIPRPQSPRSLTVPVPFPKANLESLGIQSRSSNFLIERPSATYSRSYRSSGGSTFAAGWTLIGRSSVHHFQALPLTRIQDGILNRGRWIYSSGGPACTTISAFTQLIFDGVEVKSLPSGDRIGRPSVPHCYVRSPGEVIRAALLTLRTLLFVVPGLASHRESRASAGSVAGRSFVRRGNSGCSNWRWLRSFRPTELGLTLPAFGGLYRFRPVWGTGVAGVGIDLAELETGAEFGQSCAGG